MEKIPSSEIKFHKLSRGYDNTGRVFWWQGRLFRGITREREQDVRDMFSSGMISELTKKRLIPQTEITNYYTNDYQLVLEHEIIPITTYTHEWSFTILKDSLLLAEELNQLLLKFGFAFDDVGGNNIFFHKGKPVFVDIGSFRKRNIVEHAHLSTRQKFLILKLWRSNYNLARLVLIGGWMPLTKNSQFTLQEYLSLKSPIYRFFLKFKLFKQFTYFLDKYPAVFYNTDERIIQETPRGLGKYLVRLKKYRLLPGRRRFSFERLIKKIEKLSLPTTKTKWGGYYEWFAPNKSQVSGPGRFDLALEIIKKYTDIKTIVEIASNAGVLAKMICDDTTVERIICTDYDEQAIDKLYSSIKGTGYADKILPLVINFSFPFNTINEERPSERFRSDAVMAFALTHHLILSQHKSIDFIAENLAAYTSKYLFIEFMPLGLDHSGKIKPPDWYTEEYFVTGLEKYFEILERVELGNNRILFVGIKK